jgi:hypothetical protein
MSSYWDDHDEVLVDADARSAARVLFDGDTVTQILHDPEGYDEWRLVCRIHRDASRREGVAVVELRAIERA